VPVPAQTPLTGYWRKDGRTTPAPQPIDQLLEGSWLLHRAKAGAQGIEVGLPCLHVPLSGPVISDPARLGSAPVVPPLRPAQVVETGTSWTMRFRVSMVGFSHNYSETFDKSSRECSWFMRRDMRVGGSSGAMFYTADGRVVLRWAGGLHRPKAASIHVRPRGGVLAVCGPLLGCWRG
jgi:hypothetical protein